MYFQLTPNISYDTKPTSYPFSESDRVLVNNFFRRHQINSDVFGPSLTPDGNVRVRGIEINCNEVIESLLSPIDELSLLASRG